MTIIRNKVVQLLTMAARLNGAGPGAVEAVAREVRSLPHGTFRDELSPYDEAPAASVTFRDRSGRR